MRYLSVSETAEKWNLSERSVRNYCAQERIPGAFLSGKTWKIPEDAKNQNEAIRKRNSEYASGQINRREGRPVFGRYLS